MTISHIKTVLSKVQNMADFKNENVLWYHLSDAVFAIFFEGRPSSSNGQTDTATQALRKSEEQGDLSTLWSEIEKLHSWRTSEELPVAC